MNKSDLVERICVDAGLSKACAARAVESMVRSVSIALKRDDDVTLSGFGTFSAYQRQARNGRNPQTGAIIKIKSQRVAKFCPGVDLKMTVGRG